MKRACEQGDSERKIMLRAANVFVLKSSLQMCNFKDLLKIPLPQRVPVMKISGSAELGK